MSYKSTSPFFPGLVGKGYTPEESEHHLRWLIETFIRDSGGMN